MSACVCGHHGALHRGALCLGSSSYKHGYRSCACQTFRLRGDGADGSGSVGPVSWWRRELRMLWHPDSPGMRVPARVWPWSTRQFATLSQTLRYYRARSLVDFEREPREGSPTGFATRIGTPPSRDA